MDEQTQAPEPLTPERRLQIVEEAIDGELRFVEEHVGTLSGVGLEAMLKARNMLANAVRIAGAADERVAELEAQLEEVAQARAAVADALAACTQGQRQSIADLLASFGVLDALNALTAHTVPAGPAYR